MQKLTNHECDYRGMITIPGIRMNDPFMYDECLALVTPDAAYYGNGASVHSVLFENAKLERVKCCCTPSQLGEKSLQEALAPRCYRTPEQSPQTAVDPYAKGVVPVGYGMYAFVSGIGDAADVVAPGTTIVKWNVDSLRPGWIVAWGKDGHCDVSLGHGSKAEDGSMGN